MTEEVIRECESCRHWVPRDDSGFTGYCENYDTPNCNKICWGTDTCESWQEMSE